MTGSDTVKRLEFATAAAQAAGAIALRHFQDAALQVETKSDRSVVTAADRSAERHLRDAINFAFPGDGIVGEEWGEQPGKNGWTWYLDPIDGTQAFVRGVPLFGTLIGLQHEGQSAAGVIFMPAMGEMVYAGRGLGCHWIRGMRYDGEAGFTQVAPIRAQVSSIDKMADAVFCTTWMQSFKETNQVDLFTKLCDATGVFRGWGDCYGYVLVATGRAEIMVDPVLWSWDAGPMPVILEEAGGRYTSFDGRDNVLGGNAVATNGRLHADVLKILK